MEEIKSLDSREHILLRPNMYIGAITAQKYFDFLNGEKQEIEYIPGLVKIINEIVDNSVDIAIKTDFKICNEISVKITNDSVEIQDNGPGISVKKNAEGEYLPFVCWGHAMSGSNFDDDENRKHIGMNGVGSYCTNVWSKKFVGISDDGENRYEVQFLNNASSFKENIKKSQKRGVTVKFYPDLERFGISEISEIYSKIIYERLVNLSLCFPLISFKFNSKKIKINSFKKYAELFSKDFEILEGENYQIAIMPSSLDEFQHFSYVNGLKMSDAGSHIDVVTDNVVDKIRDKLQRKFKNIKPADIKNKLFCLMFLKNFPNPKFNSQTKEKLTNAKSEISAFLGNIDFEGFSKRILKNEKIIEPIIEIFKIKEEFKRKQELKSLDKTKKIKCDNYLPATKDKKYLLICEGQSALSGIMPCFGRDLCGYFTLRGKPLNVWSASSQKFTANKELSSLYQIVKNETSLEEKEDSKEWFKISLDNKEYIVNKNDEIQIDNKWVKVEDLIKDI
jgi:DNA topoisomerase-2